MNCDLMDGRDAFLTLARDKHYEFSSLRRAQFSTLSMLYELHNQGSDKFVYTCNHCKNHVETRFHCTVCDVRTVFSSNYFFIFIFFSIFLIYRISTCVPLVKIKLAMNMQWRNSDSIWMMTHQTIRNKQIHKKHASNPFKDVFNHLCTLVNAAMPIVVYLHVKR